VFDAENVIAKPALTTEDEVDVVVAAMLDAAAIRDEVVVYTGW